MGGLERMEVMNEWMMEAKGHEDWITRRLHEYSVT